MPSAAGRSRGCQRDSDAARRLPSRQARSADHDRLRIPTGDKRRACATAAQQHRTEDPRGRQLHHHDSRPGDLCNPNGCKKRESKAARRTRASATAKPSWKSPSAPIRPGAPRNPGGNRTPHQSATSSSSTPTAQRRYRPSSSSQAKCCQPVASPGSQLDTAGPRVQASPTGPTCRSYGCRRQWTRTHHLLQARARSAGVPAPRSAYPCPNTAPAAASRSQVNFTFDDGSHTSTSTTVPCPPPVHKHHRRHHTKAK